MTRLEARPTDRSTTHQTRPVDLTSIVTFLAENLGKKLLALIVDVNVRTVDRWTGGENTPQFDQERRLRDTFQVFQLVQTVEAAPTVRAWFMGMNPQLDDLSPAEAIAAGRCRDVLAAARAFVSAG